MATHVGKDGAVYVGSNAVLEVEDWSIDVTANVVNDTAMGDDWETNKATTKSWTASISVMWDSGDTNGQEALDEAGEVTFKVYPTGNTSGNTEYSGTAIVTGISRNGSKGDLVKASISLTGTGALSQATVV